MSASAAGTAALCSSGSPLGRGEQAQEIAARSAGARRMRARPMSVHGRTVSGPRSLLAKSPGMDARRPRPRGCLFLWLLSFGQAKESNWRPRMADKTHMDVSRFSQDRPTRTHRNRTSPPTTSIGIATSPLRHGPPTHTPESTANVAPCTAQTMRASPTRN